MDNVLIFKHVPFEGPGTLSDALKTRGIRYREVNLYEEKAPRNLDGCNGLIIMGGPMNVYDEDIYPFLKVEDRLIREAISRNIPMLGICLGAQLMAKAAGAKVLKGSRKEIGWYPLYVTDDATRDPVFSRLPRESEVFQWHGDTFDIPQGAVRLAYTKLFPNQAFRIGRNAYALQFHVEVTEEMISDWIHVNEAELEGVKDYIDAENILKETSDKISVLREISNSIYQGLLK